MAYIVIADLHASILEDELSEITRNNNALIEQQMNTAISEARAYLFDHYDVDVIFAQEGQDRNAALLQCVVDMSIYRIMARCQAGSYIDDRKDRYKAAIRWLRDLQKNEIYSDLPRRPTTQQKHITYGSNPKRTNYF